MKTARVVADGFFLTCPHCESQVAEPNSGSFVLDVPGMVQLRDLLNRLIPAFQDPERVPECWQRKDGD